MNTMISNPEQQQKPVVVTELVGLIKAITPRSFEKTFEGMETKHIVSAVKICVDGLSREQVTQGLNQLRDNGFCPDPAMFRKWCLGITGFGSEQQRVRDTFKGKHAALANIIRWKNSPNTVITNAEKEAYDRCYEMFNQITHSNNAERASYLAYEAFKDNYGAVVAELSEKGDREAVWGGNKNTLSTPTETKADHKAVVCPDHLIQQVRGVGKRGGV